MKSFGDLSEQEILAVAISSEEEDGRTYADFAEGLREDHPHTAKMFGDMAAEENDHRRWLIDLYTSKFGNHIPLVRRQDVRGFVHRKKLWQIRMQGIEAVRKQAKQMEQDAGRFYRLAAQRTTDAAIRKLLGDLASAEQEHEHKAGEIEKKRLPQIRGAKKTRVPNVTSSSRLCSQVLLGLWMGRFQHLRQCLLRHLPRTIHGTPFRSEWLRHSERVSRWVSQRRWPTTVNYLVEEHRICVGWCAV